MGGTSISTEELALPDTGISYEHTHNTVSRKHTVMKLDHEKEIVHTEIEDMGVYEWPMERWHELLTTNGKHQLEPIS